MDVQLFVYNPKYFLLIAQEHKTHDMENDLMYFFVFFSQFQYT